ncbi:MAG TPA: hypothetical protein VGH11_19145 [Jatrophihabitans sp.]|jgi:hypothetical protein
MRTLLARPGRQVPAALAVMFGLLLLLVSSTAHPAAAAQYPAARPTVHLVALDHETAILVVRHADTKAARQQAASSPDLLDRAAFGYPISGTTAVAPRHEQDRCGSDAVDVARPRAPPA